MIKKNNPSPNSLQKSYKAKLPRYSFATKFDLIFCLKKDSFDDDNKLASVNL